MIAQDFVNLKDLEIKAHYPKKKRIAKLVQKSSSDEVLQEIQNFAPSPNYIHQEVILQQTTLMMKDNLFYFLNKIIYRERSDFFRCV